MPCFYCGKRVSLVRQLNDSDFCSDEHRKRYHHLTRSALSRLLEAKKQFAPPEVFPVEELVPAVPVFDAEPSRRRYSEPVAPWRPSPAEPQPVPIGSLRPQPKRKPLPPEAAFFHSQPGIPAVRAGLPRWTELNAPDPVFSSHTKARAAELILRAAEFSALHAGRPDRRAHPVRGANTSLLLPAAYIDHLDVARELRVMGRGQVQLREHISPQVRPATRPADVKLMLEGRGRGSARATLVRVPANPTRIAGLDEAGPVDAVQPSGSRRGETRKLLLDFLDFRPEIEPGRFHRRILNQLVAAGLQTSRVTPRRLASRPVEARRAFLPVQAVWSLRATLREPGLPRVSGYEPLPEPKAAGRADRARVVPPMVFSAPAMLPASHLKTGDEAAAAIAPQAAREWFISLPGARRRASAARTMPAAVFAAASASVPQLHAGRASCSIGSGEIQFTGHPAAVRPGSALPMPGSLRPMPRTGADVAWPALVSAPRVRSLAAEGTSLPGWKPAPQAAARRGRPQEAPPARFGALDCRLPSPPSAALPVRVLGHPPFQGSLAAAAAGGTAPPLAVPPQFRNHTELLELPAATVAQATGAGALVSAAGVLNAIRPGRPLARKSAPLHSTAPAFRVEARTPVYPFETRSALGTVGSFPVPAATARRGAREARGASAPFGLTETILPEFETRGTVSLLPTPDPEFRMPDPFARPRKAAQPSPAAAFRGSEEIRLLPFAHAPLRRAAVLPEQPLERTAGERAHALHSVPRLLPADEIVCRALLPHGPEPARSTRQLPRPEWESSGAAPATGKRPSPTPVRAAMPVPAAELPQARSRTATPLVLGTLAALRTAVSPLTGPRRWTASSWAPQAPATPAISAQAALLRQGSLAAAQVTDGEYLKPARREPRVAAVKAVQAAFKAQESLLPVSSGVSAREELAILPPGTVQLRQVRGGAAAVLRIEIPFPADPGRLPDIANAEGPVTRVLEARSLGEHPFEPAQGLRHVDLSTPSRPRTLTAPITITAPPGKAAGHVDAAVLQNLQSARLEKLPHDRARSSWPKASAAQTCFFEAASPAPPVSADPVCREELVSGAEAWLDRHPVPGRPRAATATVVPSSTHPAEFPGQQPLAFSHRLAQANAAISDGPARNHRFAGTSERWAAFGRESGAVTFNVLATHAQGVQWPAGNSFLFAHEPEQALKGGRAQKIEPSQFARFAPPALAQPESAGSRPSLSSSPVAKVPEPRLSEDRRSREKALNTRPVFRPVTRPSRIPAFHASVERAHMPSGVFHPLDFEDRDDYGTTHTAAGYPAPLPAPATPRADLARPVSNDLAGAGTMPVFAGPYGGTASMAGGYNEQVHNSGIFFFEEGTHLLGMDFEAIAETYSPRWRSALKTASGFFRGVMLFIPGIIVLSTILTGCSASGGSLRETIQSRATIRIENDFSAGMDGWYGSRDWAKSWTRDPAGFVRAGQLALYRPTLQLTDYQLEFLGQIENRSIGWVFRAADLQNYYATKLVVVTPGPLPQMALVRYQVVGGQESQSVQIPIRMVLHNRRPYRIQQAVTGSGFTTSIEGQVVDFWTDDRLRAGGVGFFGDKDDRPHVYWMKVSNNDDFWGKLCGIIAPNN